MDINGGNSQSSAAPDFSFGDSHNMHQHMHTSAAHVCDGDEDSQEGTYKIPDSLTQTNSEVQMLNVVDERNSETENDHDDLSDYERDDG